MVKKKNILQVTGHHFQVHFLYLSYIHHVKILFKLTVLHYIWSKYIHVATFSQIINVEILNSRLLNSLHVSI